MQSAAGSIRAGMDSLILAGGVNSASTSPKSKLRVGEDEWIDPWMPPTHPNEPDAPTRTCRSPSAGTPLWRPGFHASRWMPGRCGRTRRRSRRSTKGDSTTDRADQDPAWAVLHR